MLLFLSLDVVDHQNTGGTDYAHIIIYTIQSNNLCVPAGEDRYLNHVGRDLWVRSGCHASGNSSSDPKSDIDTEEKKEKLTVYQHILFDSYISANLYS